MSLAGHLSELRRRLIISVIAFLLLSIAGWFVYDPVFAALQQPFQQYKEVSGAEISLNFGGIGAPLDVRFRVSAFLGFALSSPIWLYHVWRFITPGLRRNERRYAFGFLGAAIPLFVFGAYLGWSVLPRIVPILLGFNPESTGFSNIVDLSTYIQLVLRIMLAFGIAFVAPVVLVALNFVGLVRGKRMLKSWRWIVFLCCTFAAIATPTDAWTMLALAVPLIGLFFIAIGISILNDSIRDRRKARAEIPDDQASPL